MNDNTPKAPPPSLPDFIFLLSDHESRALACDVAQKLYELDNAVMVFDFLAPIHEGLAAMRYIDWNVDLGEPSTDHGDDIVALEKWFNDHFGETTLGRDAWAEAQETRETNPASIVYRDATWTHLKAFLPNLKPHQFLVVSLLDNLRVQTDVMPSNLGNRLLMFIDHSVDNVVKYILEASR